MTDSFHRSLDAAIARPDSLAHRWVADYDREHPIDPLPEFRQRWICGVDPADLDEDVRMTIAWGNVFPITIETKVSVLEDDMVELFFGGGVIPLCDRRIPTRGTE